jgi:hypothetical protein
VAGISRTFHAVCTKTSKGIRIEAQITMKPSF